MRRLCPPARTAPVSGSLSTIVPCDQGSPWSSSPWRTSHQIARTLLAHGYTVLPVNPLIDTWEGLPCWPDLARVPGPIDIVNVFRRSEHVAGLVDEALAVGARCIWTQLGVSDVEAGRRAEAAGMQVVMDRCIAVELSRPH